MSTQDRVIADLVNALDAIRREATATAPRLAFIDGLAMQAIANVRAVSERNSDGYLVVKGGR